MSELEKCAGCQESAEAECTLCEAPLCRDHALIALGEGVLCPICFRDNDEEIA